MGLVVRWKYIRQLEKLHSLISPSKLNWLRNMDEIKHSTRRYSPGRSEDTCSLIITACSRNLLILEVIKFLVEKGRVDVNKTDLIAWRPKEGHCIF